MRARIDFNNVVMGMAASLARRVLANGRDSRVGY